jgi:hypothetical protein
MKMNAPYNEKSFMTSIEGVALKFRYPTIGDNIAMQAQLTLITRGQYAMLAASFDETQREAAQIALMTATLQVCVSFQDTEKKDWSWLQLNDDNETYTFVTKVYGEFVKWRDSFRGKRTEEDRQSSTGISREPAVDTSVPA